MGGTAIIARALAIGVLMIYSLTGTAGELKKQYWATSLTNTVDDSLLQGLYEAVGRGEVGWLDVDPKNPIPPMAAGINLILYHVGGYCYIGSDCDRFPSSEPTGDRWSNTERVIDLNDPAARKIVIEDLVTTVQQGDEVAPAGSIVGVHLDNVHRLSAQSLADVFNDFLKERSSRRWIKDCSMYPPCIKSMRTQNWTETECSTTHRASHNRSDGNIAFRYSSRPSAQMLLTRSSKTATGRMFICRRI